MPKSGTLFLLIGCTVLGVIAGLLGAKFFLQDVITQNPYQRNAVSYSDFVSMLLTVLTILLAIIGTLIAFLGFVGYRNINAIVESRAESSFEEAFSEGGELYEKILSRLEDNDDLIEELARRMSSKMYPVMDDSNVYFDDDENDDTDQ